MSLVRISAGLNQVTLALSVCLPMILMGCHLLKGAAQLKAETSAALAAKNYSVAAQAAQEWAEMTPNSYEPFFALAQAQAQAGDRNASIMALEQALNKGLRDDEQVETNANLQPIKSMVAYLDLMNTHFPGRSIERLKEPPVSSNVSITEKDGKQVLRAGDVVIEVPSLK